MTRHSEGLLRRVAGSPLVRPVRRAADRLIVSRHSIEAFDRLPWLYRSRGLIPKLDPHFRAPTPTTDADVALCQRLIDAHRLALSDGPPPSGMWTGDVFADRQRDLMQPLLAGDASLLADRLGQMFRSDFVIGMAGGSLGVGPQGRWAKRYSCLYTLNKLVALAESLGTASRENPEQGAIGAAFDAGLEPLVAKTEAAVGASLDFPEVGANYGVEVAGRLITPDSPDQIYAATRVRALIETYLTDRENPVGAVEIGGGYGGMAYWLNQLVDLDYTIIDLPAVNVLQGYFLTKTLGHSEVSLYGENDARVAILPTHAVPKHHVALVINKDSMPEIPRDALLDYLGWIREASDMFYSYNQEAATPFEGMPQNVVPELVAEMGGFLRLRREQSWLRRGYAEETYKVMAS